MNKKVNEWRYQWIIYAFLFSLAINFSSIYLPFAILVALTNVDYICRIIFERKFNKLWLLIFTTSTLYILILFSIGDSNLYISNPTYVMFTMLFQLFMISILFEGRSQSTAIKYLAAYLAGLFFVSLYTSYYTFVIDPLSYGYGRLISPFNDEIVNSPKFSNQLALCSIFVLYYMIKSRQISIKIILIVILIMSVAAAIFLGGRTFFYLFGIIIFAYFTDRQFRYSTMSIYNLILILIFGLFAVYLGWQNYEKIEIYLDLILLRIGLIEHSYNIVNIEQYATGLDSERANLFINGFLQILLNPLGGFNVSNQETRWFHNIFLDSARVAGWLPVLLLIFQFSILFALLKRPGTAESKMMKWFSIAVFILMQLDVVMEGNHELYLLFNMSLYILACSENKTQYTLQSYPTGTSRA